MNNLSIADDLEKEINKETRALAIRALRNLVLATPIDKGRARGNWQLSLNRPIDSTLEAQDRSGGNTINKGVGVIGGAKALDYPVIWISNNLPYIQKLNEGHSQQAPIMFVETAIKRATR